MNVCMHVLFSFISLSIFSYVLTKSATQVTSQRICLSICKQVQNNLLMHAPFLYLLYNLYGTKEQKAVKTCNSSPLALTPSPSMHRRPTFSLSFQGSLSPFAFSPSHLSFCSLCTIDIPSPQWYTTQHSRPFTKLVYTIQCTPIRT